MLGISMAALELHPRVYIDVDVIEYTATSMNITKADGSIVKNIQPHFQVLTSRKGFGVNT